MNRKLVALPSLALAMAFIAHGQTGSAPIKVGVINVQAAIIGTREGQKAAQDLQTKFDPRRKELEKKRADIEALQNQLRTGANTLAEDRKRSIYAEVDQKTKSLNRDTEDAQAEFDQEQNKVLQELGQRMMAVIDKYAKDNGYAVILDISNPQSGVLYASNTVEITQDIVKLYDQNSPGAASAAPAQRPAAAPAPAQSAPATRRPPAPAGKR